jgi:hypothetical protein
MKRAICSLQLLLLGGLMPLAVQCTDARDMPYQGVYGGPVSGGIKGVMNLAVSGTRVTGSASGLSGLNKSSAGSDPAIFRAPSFNGRLDYATGAIAVTVPVMVARLGHMEDDQSTGQSPVPILISYQRNPAAWTSRTEECTPPGPCPPGPAPPTPEGARTVPPPHRQCRTIWHRKPKRNWTG